MLHLKPTPQLSSTPEAAKQVLRQAPELVNGFPANQQPFAVALHSPELVLHVTSSH